MNALQKLTGLFLLLLSSTLSLAQTTDPPRLGVNTTTPEYTLDVNGAVNIAPDSAYRINGEAVLRTQQVNLLGNTYTSLYLGPGAGQNSTSINHFIGFQAGYSNTVGNINHFSGYQAGYNTTTGNQNYFSGYQAGITNTTGNNNLGIGFQAGPTAGDLTNAGAIGYQAQVSQSNSLVLGGTGVHAVNVGIGTTAPQYTLDVSGAINIHPDSAYRIDGEAVLRIQHVNDRGSTETNLYLGPEAGQSNTTGIQNHFSGYHAGYSNTVGEANYFIGYHAGYSNTEGFANHFSGYHAGYSNTTGYLNHFSGFGAGQANTTGSQNVYIGYRAGGSGNYTNAIAIGYEAESRGNNTVTIGNSSMTSIGGYQPWSNLSDGRFKREVTEDVPGLEFVTRLRPVSYRIDRQALQAFLHGEEVEHPTTTGNAPRETGFIAQEVEEVAKVIGYEFNGIIKPQSENDHYQLSYATFVVPLVQAVQEQQELIEEQETQIAEQQAQIEALQAKVDILEQLESRLQALESGQMQPATATRPLSQRQP